MLSFHLCIPKIAEVLLAEGTFQTLYYPKEAIRIGYHEDAIKMLEPRGKASIVLNFDGFDLVPYSPDLCSGHIIVSTKGLCRMGIENQTNGICKKVPVKNLILQR